MAKFALCVSTPQIVARNIACNIAAVESRSTSATLHATNCCVKHVACNIVRSVVPCVRAFSGVEGNVYVVAQFYPWCNLYFPLFLGVVLYGNESGTKENNYI